MDLNTTRSLIIAMRNSGMTFQAIADKLESEYGVKRSRQSVYALYKGATDPNFKRLSEDEILITCEIMNLDSLGYNMSQIHRRLKDRGFNITYQKVISVIRNNEAYANSIHETMLVTVLSNLDEMDPAVIKGMLSCDGVPILESAFNSLVKEAIMIRINRYAANELARGYRLTKSRHLIKDMCEDLSGVVSMTDVDNCMRG